MLSFGVLCEISDAKILKRLLLPVFIQFEPNVMESMIIGGGGYGYYFLSTC